MKLMKMVLVGLLLAVFALPAAAQPPRSAMSRYPVQHGVAVERTTPSPQQPIQTGPSVGQVLKGAVIAGLLGGRYYGGYGGYGYYSPYGFYNPYDPWGLNRAAAGVSQSLAGGVQGYLNGQSRGYAPVSPTSMPACKIKGDAVLANGESDDPMRIEFVGQNNQGLPVDTGWVRDVLKKRKIVSANGGIWLYGGDYTCLPFPIGFKYRVTGFTGFGDEDDPSVVFGEAGSTDGLLKANKVPGGWVFTLPPV